MYSNTQCCESQQESAPGGKMRAEEKGFGHMLSCERHPAPSPWRPPESVRGSKRMPA